jgi:hypothetical protein
MRVTPRRARRPLVGVLVVLATLVVGATAAQAAALLPDLDPDAPGRPRPTAVGGQVYLTFGAKFANVGAGPLILRGHRASTAEPVMVADQVVKQSDGTEVTIPGIGGFDYDVEYRRWGFSPYSTYELLSTSGSLIGTGPSLGFCVIDTSNPRGTLPGEPPSAVYTESASCGKNAPSRLSVEEGISIGYANGHAAGKKGQMIAITGLPTGRYLLVHRINTGGLLTEASIANNASSALIEVTWLPGQTLPSVRTVRSCKNTATCS